LRAQRALGTCISGLMFVGLAATGCTTAPGAGMGEGVVANHPAKSVNGSKVTYNYTAKDRDCLKRAMYFESEHSDHDGYMAVGTVVMNRLTSGAYPDTICGIVSQEKQFAPGVMTRVVLDQAQPDLDNAADALLIRGQRHAGVKDAMFFHTAGLKFPYGNMHYTAVAGGNSFYEKRDEFGQLETPAPLPAYEVAMNYVPVQTISTMAYFPVPTATTEAGSSDLPPLIPTAVPVPILTPPPAPSMAALPAVGQETTASISNTPVYPIMVAVPSPRPDEHVTASVTKAGG
jgi:spore germination cell wall hydrolase CwlJ-like protein